MKRKTTAIAFSVLLASLLVASAEARQPIRMPVDVFGKPADDDRPRKAPAGPQKPDKNAKSPEFLLAQQKCNPSLSRPYQHIYRDLRGVSLYVHVSPGKYQSAVDCHNRERECLEKNGALKFRPELAPQELKYITDNYRTYPAPLHRDNLVRVFGDRIRQKLMPYVLPDENCKVPDLSVVRSSSEINTAARTPDVLTVGVGLTIVDTTKPTIAVLTYGTYRSDTTQANLWPIWLTGESTAIPLDLPEDQITDLIVEFARHFEIEDERTVRE